MTFLNVDDNDSVSCPVHPNHDRPLGTCSVLQCGQAALRDLSVQIGGAGHAPLCACSPACLCHVSERGELIRVRNQGMLETTTENWSSPSPLTIKQAELDTRIIRAALDSAVAGEPAVDEDLAGQTFSAGTI